MHYQNKLSTGLVPKRSRKINDLRCMEKECKCKFYNKQLFISHLKFDHNIDFDTRSLNFISEDGNNFNFVFVHSLLFEFNLQHLYFFLQNFYLGKKTLNKKLIAVMFVLPVVKNFKMVE